MGGGGGIKRERKDNEMEERGAIMKEKKEGDNESEGKGGQ